MKKILCTIFFFCSVAAYAQEKPSQNYLLTADSLHRYPYYISKGWKFTEGDNPSMALPDFDDSRWKETKPTLEVSDTTEIFKGIGWFRLHVTCDTSVAGKPLAM